MTITHTLIMIFLLGLYHGINPAMGWLFATALGLQRNSRKAVYLSLMMITLGHAIAIALTIALVYFFSVLLPLKWLTFIAAALLFSLGVYHLFRIKHPAWFGMQIGYIGLIFWSFIIASSHGAGLMLIPFLLGNNNFFINTMIVSVHTLGYLLSAGSISILIYEKFGVAILKRGWINFDLIWAFALIIASVILLISYFIGGM